MIPPVKKILYATDLSKNSIYAFDYAVDLARRYGAQLLILNVIESISERAYGSGTEKVKQDQRKVSTSVIRKRLQRFCAVIAERDGVAVEDLVAKILVRAGNPADEILKAADEEECDLLFLGNHGKGLLAQAFLESVSRSVSTRARKPVLLVPLPADDASAWNEL